MRLEPIASKDLTNEQRELNEKILTAVRKSLQGFQSQQEDGALIGPFPAMLHFPQFGAAAWELFSAIWKNSSLSKSCQEIAILVTGVKFNSRYEIYAHERVAISTGLSETKIAAITAGQRPPDLSKQEAVAYDVTSRLMQGGQLGDTTYKAAVSAFGDQGTAELFYLIGGYCLISVLLNGYDVPVPE